MSQQPDILRLQQRLYQQFTGEESMPGKLSTSIELQAGVLKKAAVGKVALVVLDGKLNFLSLWLLSMNKVCFYRHVGFPAFEVI